MAPSSADCAELLEDTVNVHASKARSGKIRWSMGETVIGFRDVLFLLRRQDALPRN